MLVSRAAVQTAVSSLRLFSIRVGMQGGTVIVSAPDIKRKKCAAWPSHPVAVTKLRNRYLITPPLHTGISQYALTYPVGISRFLDDVVYCLYQRVCVGDTSNVTLPSSFKGY